MIALDDRLRRSMMKLQTEAMFAQCEDGTVTLLAAQQYGSNHYGLSTPTWLIAALLEKHEGKMLLAHNHPHDTAAPSMQDRVTHQLLELSMPGRIESAVVGCADGSVCYYTSRGSIRKEVHDGQPSGEVHALDDAEQPAADRPSIEVPRGVRQAGPAGAAGIGQACMVAAR